MGMIKRVALYLRVSTSEQTTENQRLALEGVVAQRGWTLVEVFEDAGISGAKGREERPGLDRMLKAAARGKFDVVMAWATDRLGRSLPDLLATLAALESAHVDLFLHQQALDTTTPAGRALFGMLGVFAEFERAMIRERVNAGIARTRAAGRRLGRPPIPLLRLQEIAAYYRRTGGPWAVTARHFGVDPSTVKKAVGVDACRG